MADVSFIECTSLNFSYDIMGLVTVSYTMVHTNADITVRSNISAGGQTFRGYIVDASMSTVPNAMGWYETNITMVATTN
jgi:hypothetical protein